MTGIRFHRNDGRTKPRVVLASLSGRSDAEWACSGSQYADAAFLGGIAIDDATRSAARKIIQRDREEFLPEDPIAFIDDQLGRCADEQLVVGFNVRASSRTALRRAGAVCAKRNALLEINAHCRQTEMCNAGAGEALLSEPSRLCEQVRTVRAAGATVSVKVRAEVQGVDLPSLSRKLQSAGAEVIHVDAMDTESVVGEIADETDLFVVANNGVRGRESVRRYCSYGADAVSVGRRSDDPVVMERVCRAVDEWFDDTSGGQKSRRSDASPTQTKSSASEGESNRW